MRGPLLLGINILVLWEPRELLLEPELSPLLLFLCLSLLLDLFLKSSFFLDGSDLSLDFFLESDESDLLLDFSGVFFVS